MKKRLLALSLALIMVFSLMPSIGPNAYADSSNGAGERKIEGGQRDFLWPVASSVSISSCFLDLMGHSSSHSAIDIVGSHYATVRASYPGTVVAVVNSCTDDYPKSNGSGFGNYVVLQHSYTTLTGGTITLYSRYSHLSSASVSYGASVAAGQKVGEIGSTGSSYGYHLDYQICYGGWSPYQTYSIDPYVNDLLELPSGLNANGADSWCTCCYNYVNYVKQLYSTPLTLNYDISISGATSPGTITQGSVFYVRGTVTSGALLTNVTSGVYDVNGSAKTEKSASPGTTSYDLANLDPYVYFNNLTPGVYRYKVTASNAQNTATLVDKVFVVLATADTISSGYYVIKYSANTSLAIDTEGHGTAANTRLVLSNDSNCAYQQVYISSEGDGYYKIKHVESGLYFDVANAASDDGTTIKIYTQNGSNAQLWQVLPAGNSYCFVPKCATGSVIDISGTAASGAPTNLWTANLTNAQLFTLATGCVHSYSYSVTTNPTTSAAGVLTGTCTKCGAKTTITLPKLTTSDYNYSVVSAASCTATGVGKYTWKTTTYGNFSFNVTIPKTDHSYTSETIPATCVNHGGVKYTCTACGYSYTDYSNVEYSDWSTTYPSGVDESLIESRTEYRYRDYQTTTSYNTSMPGWTPKSSEWQQSGTGTVDYVSSWPGGFSTSHSLYAQYNNTPKTELETATDKTVINSTGTAGYIYWHWCRDNQQAYLESMNRLIKPVYSSEFHGFHAFFSTTSPAELIAQGHNHDSSDNSYVYRNLDCCKDTEWYFPLEVSRQSYTTYRKLFTYERWTDWSAWGTTPYTASSTRQVETRTVYRYVITPLGEHQWNTGAVTTQPTCTAAGTMTFTCTACGATKSESINALGHDYHTTVIAPTCTEQGYTSHNCSRCNDSYNDTYTDALGHLFDSWIQSKAPTCTENGVERRDCTRCDFSESRDINALGHDYQGSVTSPTCVDRGYTTYSCSRCGGSYVDSYTDAVGHNIVNGACTVCGQLFPVITVGSVTAVPGETVSVPVSISNNSGFAGFTFVFIAGDALTITNIAKGELLQTADSGSFTTNVSGGVVTWFNSVNTVGEGTLMLLTVSVADDAEEGVYSIHTALKDNNETNFVDEYSESVPVEFINGTITVHVHEYTDEVTSPTCTEQGYTTHTCVCGDSYIDSYTPALGHYYIDGICTRCGATDPDYIPDPDLTIYGNNLTAAPGDTFTVPIMVSGGAGFAGFTLVVNADDSLTLSKIEKGALLRSADGMLTPNISQRTVNWTSTEDTAGEGELLILTFTLNDAAQDGAALTVGLRLKDNKPSNLANANEEPVSTCFEDFTVTVCSVLPGDVNDDGDVDTIDSIRLVRYLVDLVSLTPKQVQAADVNHDGDVTTTDSIRLARYLVGLVETLSAQPTRGPVRSGGTATVSVSTVNAEPGETVQVPVYITENPGFAGFTFTITGAEGLTLTNIEKGNLLQNADGMLTKNVAQSRVNWTSTENVTGDGELLILTFAVSANAVGGEYAVALDLKDGKPGNFANENEAPIGVTFTDGGVLIAGEDPTPETAVISVATVSAEPGETVQVPVSIVGNSGFAGFTFTISGAEGLTLTNIEKGDLLSNADGMLTKNIAQSRVNWTSSENVTGDGELMVLTFEVSSDAVGGDYPVSVALKDGKPSNFASETEEPVAVTFADGAITIEGEQGPFEDVKSNDYFYNAVCWAYQADPQITAGTSDSTFSPSQICTRAQIITFLWRAKGSPEPVSTACSFTDVPSTAYYYKAVLWAVEKGITVGTSQSSFSPHASCTRAQAMTFIWRAAGQPEHIATESPFSDVTGGYYYDAVLWAVENNITAGTGDNTFSPSQPCTRAQIITFLYKWLVP